MAWKRSRTPSPSPSQHSQAKRCRLPPTRFLIISDTHSKPLQSHPECDVVLHCGDLTEDGTPESISSAIKDLQAINAELKLAIAGNHEISLDKQYWLSEGGELSEHLKAVATVEKVSSVTFLKEGTHRFTLKSGASFSIHASPYTPKYGCSAFQYATDEDRYNPPERTPSWAKNVGTTTSIIPPNVDIVMTHGPPKYILDMARDGNSVGCDHLRRAIGNIRPKLHCFGHVHNGYGAQRVQYRSPVASRQEADFDPIEPLSKEWVGATQAKRKGYAALSPGSAEQFKEGGQTLFVNAAIMDDQNEPARMPWVVDLELSAGSKLEESLPSHEVH